LAFVKFKRNSLSSSWERREREKILNSNLGGYRRMHMEDSVMEIRVSI
jgi:hypothetical protein